MKEVVDLERTLVYERKNKLKEFSFGPIHYQVNMQLTETFGSCEEVMSE